MAKVPRYAGTKEAKPNIKLSILEQSRNKTIKQLETNNVHLREKDWESKQTELANIKKEIQSMLMKAEGKKRGKRCQIR